MKKRTILLSLLLSLALLASCSGLPGGLSETPGASPAPSATGDLPSAEPSPDDAVKTFLDGEPDAPVVAAYLRDNAASLAAYDADLLVERLVLLHQDISQDMNGRIWEDGFMTALNETLGGTLDAAKIGGIEDLEVKNAFQVASDAGMTIVRYEETPAFETDWSALAAIKAAFGGDMAVMVEYQSRLQGGYYTGDSFFDMLAADITDTEKLLADMDSGFVRWQMKQVYKRQAGRLLFGPEGSYLDAFASGDEEMLRAVDKYAGLYSGTHFGNLCARLLDGYGAGMQALADTITDSLRFPPDDPRSITETELEQDGAGITLPVLSGLKDAAVQERINTALRDAVINLAGMASGSRSVTCYVSFVSERYLCFGFQLSWMDSAGMDRFSETYRTFDMESGATVSMDDLLGKPFSEYKDTLLQLMQGYSEPGDLSEPVEFYLWDDGIALLVPVPDSDWPDYYTVTMNGLRSLTDVAKLY
jgi:hypothetical protein